MESFSAVRSTVSRNAAGFVKGCLVNPDFLAVEAELRKIKLPAIIDHRGGVRFTQRVGTSGAGHANDARTC